MDRESIAMRKTKTTTMVRKLLLLPPGDLFLDSRMRTMQLIENKSNSAYIVLLDRKKVLKQAGLVHDIKSK